MVNFVMIALCIAAGMIFRATKTIHPEAHKGINTWILYLALPAVSLKYIPQIHWTKELLFPLSGPIITLIGSYIFIRIYAYIKHYKPRTNSSLILASGFSNTSFVGFPLIMAFFGDSLIKIAIICDQTMFLLLSSVGVIIAMKGSGGKNATIQAKEILKRLVLFPPFIGCMLALIVAQFVTYSGHGPAYLLFGSTVPYELFDKLGATVGPLALFSVGLQLKFNGWKQQIAQIGMTQLYKLLLAPLLVFFIALALGLKGDIAKITVFEAAMPTLITSSIVAEQYHLNTRLINLIIGLSILVGFISSTFWFEIVSKFL